MKRLVLLLFLLLFSFGCLENTKTTTTTTYKPSLFMKEAINNIVYDEATPDSTLNYSTEKNTSGYISDPNEDLHIYFFNISKEEHASLILIKKGDLDIVYDTGSSEVKDEVIKELNDKGVDDIELLIISEDEKGRSENIEALTNNFYIENVWYNGMDADYVHPLEMITNVKQVSYPYSETLNGIELKVINPTLEDGSFKFSEQGNNAIAVLVKDRGIILFISGGILGGAQNFIANSYQDEIKSDIFEIPVYGVGEGTAATDLLLTKVSPKVAIIDGSKNDWTNSRYTIKNKLDTKGIKYYEVYENGTIDIKINSSGYFISTK